MIIVGVKVVVVRHVGQAADVRTVVLHQCVVLLNDRLAGLMMTILIAIATIWIAGRQTMVLVMAARQDSGRRVGRVVAVVDGVVLLHRNGVVRMNGALVRVMVLGVMRHWNDDRIDTHVWIRLMSGGCGGTASFRGR